MGDWMAGLFGLFSICRDHYRFNLPPEGGITFLCDPLATKDDFKNLVVFAAIAAPIVSWLMIRISK